jgi:antitoxin (DNA-binding transcriptional repressor) of toxin-antitoxin stability system
MRQVGLRELKNQLSAYVRLAGAGEHVRITDRGHVVAELVPPLSKSDVHAGLTALERRGLLRPPSGKGRARYPRFPRVVPADTAQRLVDEDRGER